MTGGTHRVELPLGQWADVVTRLTYAQRRRILAARGTPDYIAEAVAAMVAGWQLLGVDGQPIPSPVAGVDGIPTAALDAIPADLFDVIAEAAADVMIGAPDPNATGEPSHKSPPAPESPSATSSPTPTSLPITPDGPGTRSRELQPT